MDFIRKWVVPGFLLAMGVVVVLLLTGAISLPATGRSAVKPRTETSEFMYLDTARVDSYLGQLNGGSVQSENRREVTTQNSNVGLELDTVGKANVASGSQLTRNVVVSQSAAGHFDELLEAVKSRSKPTEEATQHPCRAANRLGGATPGSMLMISSVLLQMPPYLSAYPELRFASYRLLGNQTPLVRVRGLPSPPLEVFGPPPLSRIDQVTVAVEGGIAKKEREEFKKRAGANPRIPFSFSVPATAAAEDQLCKKEHLPHARVTVVIPARFANLTGDPELLAVPLTIVGKVVNNIRERTEEIRGKQRAKESFGDGLSLSEYWPALRSVKPRFLRELGVHEKYLRLPPTVLHERLFGALERSLSFAGHVVVVVPVAIFD
jgi:hypothetical protein